MIEESTESELAESIDRMGGVIQQVLEVANRALGAVRHADRDGERLQLLSSAVSDIHNIVHMSIRQRSEYHTPKEAIDFVMANPPLGCPVHDEPMPESPADESHSLKIAGVPARYVKCPGKYIAVAVNERHDYLLSVQRLTPGNVVAEFSIDGESQFRMTGRNFEVGRRCAIAAARAYAKYKAHLAQNRKARKERIRAEKAAAKEAQP